MIFMNLGEKMSLKEQKGPKIMLAIRVKEEGKKFFGCGGWGLVAPPPSVGGIGLRKERCTGQFRNMGSAAKRRFVSKEGGEDEGEEGREKGRREGRKEGRKKGRQEGRTV